MVMTGFVWISGGQISRKVIESFGEEASAILKTIHQL